MTRPTYRTLRKPSTGTSTDRKKTTAKKSGGIRMPSTGETALSTGYADIRRKKSRTIRKPSSSGPASDFLQ